MGQLLDEVRQWNSPSVGAYMLWRFTAGYCDTHPDGDAPVALLHFLAVPLLTDMELLKPISNRRADLQSYVRSFEQRNTDVFVTVQDRAKEKRAYTLAAIDIAVSKGLISWEASSGKLYPRNDIKPKRGNAIRPALVKDGYKAEILGGWFAEHSISTIATYLKVVL